MWHWFSGCCGTNNDQTMVDMLPLSRAVLTDAYAFSLCPAFSIEEGVVSLEVPYLPANGVYFEWTLFAKPIHYSDNDNEQKYTTYQDAIRKGIDRCFGVLQDHFNILRIYSHYWNVRDIVRS